MKSRKLNGRRISSLRELRESMRRSNQKGFTLIELLVVISILGILAAIVTMSLVGITSVATARAASTEKATVQAAYDAMLEDQGVAASAACPNAGPSQDNSGFGGATNAMDTFPSSAAWQDQSNPTNLATVHDPKQLFPHYLRQKTTHGTYHCDSNGQIWQDSYTP